MSAAAELIRKVGIMELAGTDGCLCMHCHVQHVSVDVSCRKSNSAIEKVLPGFYGITLRVHSKSLDADGVELLSVAEEVSSQLIGEGYAIAVRFCDYADDAKMKCVYCGEPRTNASGYLCNKHQADERVAKQYDLSALDFVEASLKGPA